jgi:hypothetical protein
LTASSVLAISCPVSAQYSISLRWAGRRMGARMRCVGLGLERTRPHRREQGAPA